MLCAPCFRRATELPDKRPSGKGYRPGSYRRTSPTCRRRPLYGAFALRICAAISASQSVMINELTNGRKLQLTTKLPLSISGNRCPTLELGFTAPLSILILFTTQDDETWNRRTTRKRICGAEISQQITGCRRI